MEFWQQLDEIRTRWNVLEHPFYTRWSRGELTEDELAVYAGEYRHAVVALADASERAAGQATGEQAAVLTQHAREERAHVNLWDAFTKAAGGESTRTAAPETAECAVAWAGEQRDLLQGLVAMYAIESAQPAISATKLEGLKEHYDYPEGPATAYFALHAVLDKEHAETEKTLIEPMLDGADVDGLLVEAEQVLAANWRLLDGVERLNGRVAA